MHTPKKSFDTPPGRSVKSSGSKTFSPITDEGGRFIPNRVSSNLKLLFEKAELDYNSDKPEDQSHKFSDFLHSQFFKSPTSECKSHRSLFRYRPPLFPSIDNKENLPFSIFESSPPHETQALRNFSKSPYKILDAPSLRDDFYIDVVSWSCKNVIAIGLNNEVYLWSAETLKVRCLCSLSGDIVTSVHWSGSGDSLAVGSENGKLYIYDTNSLSLMFNLNSHQSRIGTLSWNQFLLSSGSRDGCIVHQDLRTGSVCARISAHRQEVCKIKWSPNNDYLVSGGNDNKIMVWDSLNTSPVSVLSGHTAAVKALDWCPYSANVLASGGGTADKTIRLWNCNTSEQTSCIETNSQVCNLRFSGNTQELITSHGYSENLIKIWKHPGMVPVGELRGHCSRVLFMDLSPDKETVVTGAGDETLRFWKVFPSGGEREHECNTVSLALNEVR